MQNRRYPFQEVGRRAAFAFGLAGAITGVTIGGLTGGGGGIVISAALWAVIGGLVAYLVYASQGAQRPGGYVQASAADGVVAGVLIGFIGAALTLAGLSGFGASSGGGPSTVLGIIAVVGAMVGGGIIGGLWGLALAAVAGDARMARIPPPSARRAGKRSQASKKSKRR